MEENINPALAFRWLGVAGLELHFGSQTVLIDPFFSRPPFYNLVLGRPRPNRQWIHRHVDRADAIFITHSHYDHLMDAGEVSLLTGAVVYGSANTCKILHVQSLPLEKRIVIRSGGQLDFDSYRVEIFPAEHIRTPMDRTINHPLPARLSNPLRLTDYRMDECFSFLFHYAGQKILVGNYPIQANILFGTPWPNGESFKHLLAQVQPQVFIPIHWDNFFRPLSLPIQPGYRLPTWRRPFHRFHLEDVRQQVLSLSPQTKTILPEIFVKYSVN